MEKRKRTPLIVYPTWNRYIETWTSRQVRLNLWRFDHIDGFDDVMQEARMLFCKLERKYPSVTDVPHFFTLYKTSLFRMFIDKSRRKRDSVIDQNTSVDEMREEALPESSLQNYGHLALILEELPDELKTVLRILTSGRVRLKVNKPTRKLLPRENYNMHLRRLMEKPDANGRVRLRAADLVGELRSYLTNT